MTLYEISNANVELVANMIVDFEDVNKMIRRLKSYQLPSDFISYRVVLLDLEQVCFLHGII